MKWSGASHSPVQCCMKPMGKRLPQFSNSCIKPKTIERVERKRMPAQAAAGGGDGVHYIRYLGEHVPPGTQGQIAASAEKGSLCLVASG